MSLKFVHAADLHLDRPFSGLSEAEPKIADLLHEATFKAFDNIIELCLSEKVDFLLVAGDVYDGKDRSLRAQLRFREGLTRLSEAGIWSYVVHGNHDPLDGWMSSLKWPSLCHVFGGKVESIVYEKAGDPAAVIHGVSFRRREVRENLCQKFKREDAPLFQIGLLHCNVGTNTGHEPYAPCTLADLEHVGLDYWALGHVHKTSVLRQHGPCIVYPGVAQATHVNESGPHGCFLVSVDDCGMTDARFVPTDAVRWRQSESSIAGIDDEERLIDDIQQCLENVQRGSDERPTICRLKLVGRGPMHSVLTKPGYMADLADQLRRFGAALSPIVWPADIRSETRPDIDIRARRESEDIVGDCLRFIHELRQDAEARSGLCSEAFKDLFGHHRVRAYLDEFDDETLQRIIDASESLLIDELLGEDE